MAEEQQQGGLGFSHQHTEDLKEDETQSGDKSRPADVSDDVKQQYSEVTKEAPRNSGDEMVPTFKDDNSAENVRIPGTEGSSPSEGDNKTNTGDSILAENESHSDDNRESHKTDEPAMTYEEMSDEGSSATVPTAGEDHNRDKKALEANHLDVLNDRNEQVDGPIKRDSTAINDTNTEGGGDLLNTPALDEEKNTLQDAAPEETPFLLKGSEVEQSDKQGSNVETIGPTPTEDTEPAIPEATRISGGKIIFWISMCGVVILGILIQHCLKSESPPQKNDVRQIDIFLKQMEKVKTRFPNQRDELWNRSRIHLKRHLQTARPTEPVSLILTSGLRAERTLRCLAQSLASAFSSARNASVLHIDGASKASQDSDQVKLDIDSKLQGAFEGDKPVAVIHRFEELPPGSTLIFYRYCDHENAAYKKTFLIFTVLLDEEEEIPAKIHLSTVEEMVDDHLQKKFLSNGYPVSFDRMDLDKYGGLWSRISHLILPVAAEERIERGGC